MAELERLIQRLEADTSDFNAGVRGAQQDLQRFGRQSEDTTRRTERGFSRLGRAARALAPVLGALTAALSVGAITRSIRSTLELASSIEVAAERANVGAEFLQRLRFAAEQTGTGARTLDDALTRLNRRIGLFTSDAEGPAANAIRELGLASELASGQLQTQEERVDRVLQVLAEIPDTAQQAARASQLFGEDAGPRMASLLDQGVDGMDRLRRAAPVLTETLTSQAREINDEYNAVIGELTITFQSFILETVAGWKDILAILKLRPDFDQAIAALTELDLKIGATTRELQRLKESGASEAVLAPLEAEIARLRAERDAINEEIEASFPERLEQNRQVFEGAPQDTITAAVEEERLDAVSRRIEEIERENELLADQRLTQEAVAEILRLQDELGRDLTENERLRLAAVLQTQDALTQRGGVEPRPTVGVGVDPDLGASASARRGEQAAALTGELGEADRAIRRIEQSASFAAAAGITDMVTTAEGLQNPLDSALGTLQQIGQLALRVALQVGIESLLTGGAGGFQTGGRILRGQAGVVGEGGEEELFIPDTSGQIIPASKLPRGGFDEAGGSVINLEVVQDLRGADVGAGQAAANAVQQMAPLLMQLQASEMGRRSGLRNKMLGRR